MKTLLLTLSLAVIACAQPAAPQLGFLAAPDHSLRPVLGLAGSPLLGSPVLADVTSAAWSGSFGFAKTNSSLLVFDASHALSSIEAAPGPALFAFHPDGSPALALLPDTGLLYAWMRESLKQLSFRADLLRGQPVAMAALRSDRVSLVVQREDGLWMLVVSNRGELLSQAALPGLQAPVLLQSDGALLFVDGTALMIRSPAGIERHVEVGFSISEMAWMGAGWLRVAEGKTGAQYAVRIMPGSETISQLPEAP